jgi:hypothetical protein
VKSLENLIAEILNQTTALQNFQRLGLNHLIAHNPSLRKGLLRQAAAALACGLASLQPNDLERFQFHARKELFPQDFTLEPLTFNY